MTTRLQEFFGTVPPCTLFYTGLCIIIYIYQLIFGGINSCAISAYAILKKFEIHRIFLSTFTHLDFMHIVFNLLSYNNINKTLERKYGSVFMFYLTLLFTLINGLLYVFIYYLLSFIYAPFLYVSAAGFSGVIFSLLTVESYVIEVDTLSVFGLFSVPRRWFAVVYLFVMSILMPGVSFIGHLCGVISGFLFVSGYLNWLIPMHFLVSMERGFIGNLMKKSASFIYIPELHEVIGSSLSFRSMLELAFNGIQYIVMMLLTCIKYVVLFVYNSIFPPVFDNDPNNIRSRPRPASGLTSDIELAPIAPIAPISSSAPHTPRAPLTAEEQRKQRLQALAARNMS